jgi:hypothetical protein
VLCNGVSRDPHFFKGLIADSVAEKYVFMAELGAWVAKTCKLVVVRPQGRQIPRCISCASLLKNMARWRSTEKEHCHGLPGTSIMIVSSDERKKRVQVSKISSIDSNLLFEVLRGNTTAIKYFHKNSKPSHNYTVSLGEDIFHFRPCRQIDFETLNSSYVPQKTPPSKRGAYP